MNRHTISLFVANKPGVLLRICLVFSRRGFNIESLQVSSALDGAFSRMTITAEGDEAVLEQIKKQVAKLIDVVHVEEYNSTSAVQREMALIKVVATEENRSDILQIVSHFKAETVDMSQDTMIIQIIGDSAKLDSLVNTLQDFEILELLRSGKLMMAKGKDRT